MQKFKPILFSTPMVQAILEGRKTMTRRLVKGNYLDWIMEMGHSGYEDWYKKPIKLPIEKLDILWVREIFMKRKQMTGWPYGYKATAMVDGDPVDEKWKPSLFMPKDACRIFLEVTNVRMERLQDISEEDAIAEGVICEKINVIHKWKDYSRQGYLPSAKFSFFSLWEKINGKESVSQNPWVWVYEFKQIQKPENF